MNDLRLRFDSSGDEYPLAVGVHGIGRTAGAALGPVDTAPLVNVCVDRRGVWMTVAEGTRGVHVNGRPVMRMAMLRLGDSVYVEGQGIHLVAARPPEQPEAGFGDSTGEAGDVRIVLRGVGGQYHGRSFTLERPRLVGRVPEADIRIDEPAFPERHARLEVLRGRVVLRDLGSPEGSLVNGEAVRDAALRPGDQVVFDAQHRFVLEAPSGFAAIGSPAPEDGVDPPAAAAAGGSGMRLPWLVIAAVLLAGVLALLLLFGTG